MFRAICSYGIPTDWSPSSYATGSPAKRAAASVAQHLHVMSGERQRNILKNKISTLHYTGRPGGLVVRYPPSGKVRGSILSGMVLL